jgi:hypothetical protein
MKCYRERHGALPDDITDRQGKPLLSWRVRLLPHLDGSGRYKQFRLDEPWDSPHNRQLIEEVPRCYSSWYHHLRRETCYLRPRGEGTAFPLKPSAQAQAAPIPSRQIWLVEANRDRAVIWTRPGDLDYDPEDPRAGLGQQDRVGFFRSRGGLVSLADERTLFVSETTDPDLLRSLFAPADAAPTALDLPWYVALVRPPWCRLAVPSVLLSLVVIAGAVVIASRACRGKVVSPGESLWLILGVTQAVFLLYFVLCYRVAGLSPLWSGNLHMQFFFVPRFFGGVAGVVALIRYRSTPGWRGLFIVNFILWSFATLDAFSYDQHLYPEQAWVAAAPPFVLGGIAVVALVMTWRGVAYPGMGERRYAHWAGLLLCLLPLLGFTICFCGGLGYLRPWLWRVLV